MRTRWLPVLIILVLIVLGYVFFTKNREKEEVIASSGMIEKQIKNVSKLIITEGYFSDIISYKDAKGYFGNMISFEKKALIVVNAEVMVSYDIKEIKYDIDQENKVLRINNIPKAEVKIYPKLEYHSIDDSTFNSFSASDYNVIRDKAEAVIRKKVEGSTMLSNAENRLITELSKLFILTNSLGWKLVWEGKEINSEKEIAIKD